MTTAKAKNEPKQTDAEAVFRSGGGKGTMR